MTTTQTATKGPRVVKRYRNRKLYDTATSQYVTLTTLIGFITAGEEVQVIDNATQTDVTGQTLLKAIIETEQDVETQVGTLRDILKAGGLGKYIANTTASASVLGRLSGV